MNTIIKKLGPINLTGDGELNNQSTVGDVLKLSRLINCNLGSDRRKGCLEKILWNIALAGYT
jgi:hypothetical protein